jgi:hypothetical protein
VPRAGFNDASRPPDAISGLEAHLVAVLLSCIVLQRRRAQARRHRLAAAPAIVKSNPWPGGFTVEGRAPNMHRHQRKDFIKNRLEKLSPEDFVKRYKVRKHTFLKMVEKLRPILEPDKIQAVRSSGSPVPTDLQLSMTLRLLAGAFGSASDTMPLLFSHHSPPCVTQAPSR